MDECDDELNSNRTFDGSEIPREDDIYSLSATRFIRVSVYHVSVDKEVVAFMACSYRKRNRLTNQNYT